MPSPIAIIIPALNEEAALAPMLDGLRAALDAAACVDADIVVVDNGSRGATAAVARERGARVVSEPRRGCGQACLAGMAALSPNAEIVVFLDADESDDPEDLAGLLAPVREGKAPGAGLANRIEMQIKAHRRELRVVELPVNYWKRIAGSSKISGSLLGTLRAGRKILWTIAKYGLSSDL